MNHYPQGILFFQKSLIMWSLYKGTWVRLIYIYQFSIHTASLSKLRSCCLHSEVSVNISSRTWEGTSLAFQSICLEDLIKQEENSSLYVGLAVADVVRVAGNPHSSKNSRSFTLVTWILNKYFNDPSAVTQLLEHKCYPRTTQHILISFKVKKC